MFSVVLYVVISSRKMANFSVFEDEDFEDIFLTQSSSGGDNSAIVSLEENEGFRSILDPNFSDISDVDDDSERKLERRLRYILHILAIYS